MTKVEWTGKMNTHEGGLIWQPGRKRDLPSDLAATFKGTAGFKVSGKSQGDAPAADPASDPTDDAPADNE